MKSIELAKKHFKKLGVDYPDSRFHSEEEALTQIFKEDVIQVEERNNIHIDVFTYADIGLVAQHLYRKDNVTARLYNEIEDNSIIEVAKLLTYNIEYEEDMTIMFDSTESEMFEFYDERVKLVAVCTEEPKESEWEDLMRWVKSTPNASILNEVELKKRHPFATGISKDGSLLLANKSPIKKVYVDVSKSLYEKDGKQLVDIQKISRAFALATRYALRETLTQKANQRDRTIAIVPRNWTNLEKLESYDVNAGYELLGMLQRTVRESSESYCYALRIPLPLADTTFDVELDNYGAYDNMNHFYSSHNSCATVSKNEITTWEDIKDNWDDHLYVQFA